MIYFPILIKVKIIFYEEGAQKEHFLAQRQGER